ncbi:heterokaryon incompatibility protein-domain-containing protein [Xylariaceae sp. AK1471]|nr:heterokaryon incompatibility protein-domain-containing protein [Xylariaceae sp. AK1471]
MAVALSFDGGPATVEKPLALSSYVAGSIYEYSVLSHPSSIRVFVLSASLDLATSLQGEIIEQRLSGGGTEQGYTALSYAWGDRRNTHEIKIGSRRLSIGSNLHSALRDLRRRDCPIRLWVDAICINQDDVNERNHQVQQMRNIYSSALETVIYLGDRNGGHTEFSAWNFLERHATWAMNENRNIDLDRPARMKERTAFRGELPDVEIDVLQRPWFRRLWVFQEVVVSKTLSIQCGNRRISWDDFCKILLLSPRYHDHYGFSFGRVDRIEIVRDMFQARFAYQDLYGMGHVLPPWHDQVQTYKHNTLDILNLLQKTRRLESSDPRDKIFGLLGVSAGIDVDHWRFAIDYGQDCRTLYINFARNIMCSTRNYDILSYLDHGLVHTHVLGDERELPSWVPNWNRSPGNSPVPEIMRTILSTLDPESEVEKTKNQQSFDRYCNWVDAGEILVALGETIGRIKHLGPVITITSWEETAFDNISKLRLPKKDKQELVIRRWRERLAMLCAAETGIDSPFLPEFKRLLGCPPYVEITTVEYHLLARARKTASWAHGFSIPSTPIVDNTSIVDGKRIAVYSVYGADDIEALAIIPKSAREGDVLIHLRGGRVPFTIRVNNEIGNEDGYLDIDFGLRKCKLVGESVVNRATAVSSMWRERVFLIK